ncbi:unnamed protein product [Rangifer tarandus platyrhynchus]|uniref:Uncharacterized protein n=1 Tax=Rangifer tarandus platyrhynchus TaxID=3082113 RepID=A0ABN8YU23_RANTA|nr:unnamed protein product [Rangifer tarandus platyrhynchus]
MPESAGRWRPAVGCTPARSGPGRLEGAEVTGSGQRRPPGVPHPLHAALATRVRGRGRGQLPSELRRRRCFSTRMCCGLGTSGKDPRQETRPGIARLLSRPVALALPTPRGRPRDLLGRGRRTPFVPFSPRGVGRGRDDSCGTRWVRVLHPESRTERSARRGAGSAETPGLPDARGLQRGDLPSEAECVIRRLIFAA